MTTVWLPASSFAGWCWQSASCLAENWPAGHAIGHLRFARTSWVNSQEGEDPLQGQVTKAKRKKKISCTI